MANLQQYQDRHKQNQFTGHGGQLEQFISQPGNLSTSLRFELKSSAENTKN